MGYCTYNCGDEKHTCMAWNGIGQDSLSNSLEKIPSKIWTKD